MSMRKLESESKSRQTSEKLSTKDEISNLVNLLDVKLFSKMKDTRLDAKEITRIVQEDCLRFPEVKWLLNNNIHSGKEIEALKFIQDKFGISIDSKLFNNKEDNAFLFAATLYALPELIHKIHEAKEIGSPYPDDRINTSSMILDSFSTQWILQQEKILEEKGLLPEKNPEKMDYDPSFDFKEECLPLCLQWAEAFGVAKHEGKESKDKPLFKAPEGLELAFERALESCPLRRKGEGNDLNSYEFLHPMLTVYFATRAVHQDLLKNEPINFNPPGGPALR